MTLAAIVILELHNAKRHDNRAFKENRRKKNEEGLDTSIIILGETLVEKREEFEKVYRIHLLYKEIEKQEERINRVNAKLMENPEYKKTLCQYCDKNIVDCSDWCRSKEHPKIYKKKEEN